MAAVGCAAPVKAGGIQAGTICGWSLHLAAILPGGCGGMPRPPAGWLDRVMARLRTCLPFSERAPSHPTPFVCRAVAPTAQSLRPGRLGGRLLCPLRMARGRAARSRRALLARAHLQAAVSCTAAARLTAPARAQAIVDDQPMTVLEVRRDFVKVVVSKTQSRKLEELAASGAPPGCRAWLGIPLRPAVHICGKGGALRNVTRAFSHVRLQAGLHQAASQRLRACALQVCSGASTRPPARPSWSASCRWTPMQGMCLFLRLASL